MFLLAGEALPHDGASLARSLRDGLQRVMRIPVDRETVLLEGGAYPGLERLRVDVTGAEVRADARSPVPPEAHDSTVDVRADRFEVAAHPLMVEGARVWLDVRADGSELGFRDDRAGNRWLVLLAAREGKAEMRLAGVDFEALLLAGLKTGAARQGVRVEDVRSKLTQIGPRALGLELWIAAARRVVLADVRATVRASGWVEVDDRLDATLRDLRVEGEGPVGGVVAKLAAPYLRRYDGRALPLTGLPLGVDLHDVRVEASDGLRVTASFGGSTVGT